MADQVNTSGSGGSAGMGIIVGALVVGLLVVAFFVFGGDLNTSGDKDVDIKIETPATGGGTGGGNGGGNQGSGQGQ